MNKNIIPSVIVPWAITFNPPYQTKSPIVTEVESSAIGKKIELNHTVLSHAFLCFSLILTKFSYSIFLNNLSDERL